VKTEPASYGDGDADGGYDAPRTATSPSSPPTATGITTVVAVGGGAATTALCADTAVADPAEFAAVTATRNVDPTSPDDNRYDDPVAPATSTHAEPDESHRRHWYANEIGVDPDHDPCDADNDDPLTADPDTTGNTEFAGGCGVASGCTAAVAADDAVGASDASACAATCAGDRAEE
jgi:hypothetical protein